MCRLCFFIVRSRNSIGKIGSGQSWFLVDNVEQNKWIFTSVLSSSFVFVLNGLFLNELQIFMAKIGRNNWVTLRLLGQFGYLPVSFSLLLFRKHHIKIPKTFCDFISLIESFLLQARKTFFIYTLTMILFLCYWLIFLNIHY